MEQNIKITGLANRKCPVCGCDKQFNISFDGSDGGCERKMKDGNELLTYSCRCRNCGAILESSYLFVGNLTLAKVNEMTGDEVEKDCYDTTQERDWDKFEKEYNEIGK